MRANPGSVVALAFAALACSSDAGPTGPAASVAASPAANFEHVATGGYHFTIPADFNGGVFGIEIDNRVTVNARRDADGNVSGHYTYEQSALGESFVFKGTVTCFSVYDTPVLERFEDIPPMTGNRAKWGGVIEKSNDATLPPGGFIWFQSIDNGEGSGTPPDLSTLSGFGDEAANEAFCASPNVPNPRFGPHPVQGNIQVR